MTHRQNSTPGHARLTDTYLRSKVMSATQEELRLMLIDGAIRFGAQGRDALARKDFENSFTAFSQCRDIILELLTTIRPDANPELAERVKALYAFMYKHLVEGVHEKDMHKIDRVIELLRYERETWVMVMEQLAAEKSGASKSAPSPAQPTPANDPASPKPFVAAA
ncbi:MAG: flagellar export chaperone FliS [Phycisphaeraceae bacterium]|nr:flagellar export chaperone FliS [Phycisphaeraceae bacterium]